MKNIKKAVTSRRPRITVANRLSWIREFVKEFEGDVTWARKNHKKMEISPANMNALLVHVTDVIVATCGFADLPALAYIVEKALKRA